MLENGDSGSESKDWQFSWKIPAAWLGAIVSLSILGFVLLYSYGDPRPINVNAQSIVGEVQTNPNIVAGEQYYRITAKFTPLESPKDTADPIGKLWAAVFSDVVKRAGVGAVKIRMSHPASLSMPRDEDGYILLNAKLGDEVIESVTPFMPRRALEKVELRLDVEMANTVGEGILIKFLRLFGNDSSSFSGWISVHSDSNTSELSLLNKENSRKIIKDFSGRSVGVVQIRLESKNNLLFGEFFEGGEFERLILSGGSIEARKAAILSLIGGRVDSSEGYTGFQDALVTRTKEAFSDEKKGNQDTLCKRIFTDINEDLGATIQDAAGIAFLATYDASVLPGARFCGDWRIADALSKLGVRKSLARLGASSAVQAKRRAGKAALGGRLDKNNSILSSSVCLGLSGPRVAQHCRVLNRIAREWKGGAKFLQMLNSRRYILPKVGLQEPTSTMEFAARRFLNRRQLLVHIALSAVLNFGCFRMVHQDPDYFEALLYMREGDSDAGYRLDVYEFAFESDGQIGRIRRRAALPSDIAKARRLPDTSQCRREFLEPRATEINRAVRTYWRFPSLSG